MPGRSVAGRIRGAMLAEAAAMSAAMTPVAEQQIAADFPRQGRDVLLGGMTPEALAANMLCGYRYYLAENADGIVGVIGMRGYSHLYHLFVTRSVQGNGVGRLLWLHARDASLAELQLRQFTVFSSAVAEGFYRQLGFYRTGNPKIKNGVTAIPMRLDVPD
ncbi:MAG: GNAT family N-acetyltransferase [Gammaproteobacteria bacterium]|nr:GNAT family N-acetyltransferase [Gammaproteobacteria bacterium]